MAIARELSETGETPVVVGAGRRRFTVEYKSWVVLEAIKRSDQGGPIKGSEILIPEILIPSHLRSRGQRS